MKVVTYWQDAGVPLPIKLVDLWLRSWVRHGFEPIMAKPEDAARHPRHAVVKAWAEAAPTVNDRRFEMACWLRWCAYARHAPAVFADCDVIDFGCVPEMIPQGDFVNLGGATVYATKIGIEGFISFFPRVSRILVGSKEHVSDVYALDQYALPEPLGKSICVLAGSSRELTAPLVHFGNASVKPEWRFNERWRAVEDLYARRNT
jgi:hypothetical protein